MQIRTACAGKGTHDIGSRVHRTRGELSKVNVSKELISEIMLLTMLNTNIAIIFL